MAQIETDSFIHSKKTLASAEANEQQALRELEEAHATYNQDWFQIIEDIYGHTELSNLEKAAWTLAIKESDKELDIAGNATKLSDRFVLVNAALERPNTPLIIPTSGRYETTDEGLKFSIAAHSMIITLGVTKTLFPWEPRIKVQKEGLANAVISPEEIEAYDFRKLFGESDEDGFYMGRAQQIIVGQDTIDAFADAVRANSGTYAAKDAETLEIRLARLDRLTALLEPAK